MTDRSATDRSTAELIGELGHQASRLVRDEIWPGADFASVAHARMDALEARRELVGVIDELAAKADVKARLGRQLRTHKREVAVTAAVVAAAIIGAVLWRKR